MSPSKKQGLRLTSKYKLHWESGWCGHNPAVPAQDPSQREGPLGIDLRSSFRRGQPCSAICSIAHTSARGVGGSRSEPFPCCSVHLHGSGTCFYFCGYPEMTWWLWRSPRCAHTGSLSVSNVISCTNGWDVTPSVFQGCSVLLQSSACFWIWRSWHKGLPFQTTSIAVFFTLCCRVFLALPAQWGFCPSPPKSSVFILLYNLNWIFLLNSFNSVFKFSHGNSVFCTWWKLF